ncbi:zinc ABC transporter ATP-binding protein AztA [Amycolatopsis endophytica]|uniref:Zinc/manganese transport system ATP-binding protein n=1 Tax=Amycolatopsis endophytica TaxID=860233 RepID=A0A853BEU1_9PSEU|nr:zinc ABC transporter ATP-binding protein AztA [Amycolatopsis endophytica]NYI93285.1 zinc/manganese transport system ATP-binding protein [Amycolatopsis endophytica]
MTHSTIRAGATLEGVSAGYARRTVLHDVSVSFPAGAVTAVVGANGSGKSTLLGVLAGILRQSGGTVTRPAGPPALVVQHDAVPPLLPITVRETVEMGRWPVRRPWQRLTRHDRTAVDDALAATDLTALSGRRLSALSGGQRQRALLAQALAREAHLLLLDEPTASLDVPGREAVSRALRAMAEEGMTVVQATHDLPEAQRADHCVLLREGRVLAAGPPADLLTGETLLSLWS